MAEGHHIESAEAEQARTDVRLTYDDYRVARAVRRQRRGRIRTDDLSTRPHQLLVVVISGIAEAFALQALVRRGGNEKKARDWDGQVKEWAALGVDLALECPTLEKVRGFYETRTAVAHAGGHLTSAQLKEPRRTKVLAFLSAAGVDVSQRQVLVDEGTADECVRVVLQFVGEVEALAMLPAPRASTE